MAQRPSALTDGHGHGDGNAVHLPPIVTVATGPSSLPQHPVQQDRPAATPIPIPTPPAQAGARKSVSPRTGSHQHLSEQVAGFEAMYLQHQREQQLLQEQNANRAGRRLNPLSVVIPAYAPPPSPPRRESSMDQQLDPAQSQEHMQMQEHMLPQAQPKTQMHTQEPTEPQAAQQPQPRLARPVRNVEEVDRTLPESESSGSLSSIASSDVSGADSSSYVLITAPSSPRDVSPRAGEEEQSRSQGDDGLYRASPYGAPGPKLSAAVIERIDRLRDRAMPEATRDEFVSELIRWFEVRLEVNEKLVH